MRGTQPLQPSDPTVIGRFRLTARLGSGGQGVVYLGEDESGRLVAVKVPHLPAWADAEMLARLARELEMARRTTPAFTARVVEADLESSPPYIVSEYIDGPSLRELVADRGPLHPDAVHRLATGLATGLAAIHQAGIVHRDVKPDNVLMGPDGPRLIDFGIARLPDGTMTSTGELVGTPLYMAPEVFEGERASAAADVFAWGAVVAYAARGRHVFEGGEMAAVMRRIVTDEPDLTFIPDSIRPVVAAALAKRPTDRPGSTDILLRLVGGAPAGADTEAVRRSKARRHYRTAAVVAAALLATATALVFVRYGDASPTTSDRPSTTITTPPADDGGSSPPDSGDGGTHDPAAPGEGTTTDPAPPGDGATADPGQPPQADSPPAVSDGDTRAYYDVTPEEHGRQVKELRAAGFRPLSLSITDRGYTALWREAPGPPYVTAHGLSGSAYQDFFDQWSAKGYAETIAVAHDGDTGPVFASVMEKNGGAFMAYHGQTSSQLSSRNAQARGDGLIPVWITAHGTEDEVLFNAAWIANPEGAAWSVTTGQSAQEFQAEFDKRARDFLRPEVTIAPDGTYTAIWKKSRTDWYCYSGMTTARHVAKLREMTAKGYRLTRLVASQVGSEVQYSMLLLKD